MSRWILRYGTSYRGYLRGKKPLEKPRNRPDLVNQPQTEGEVSAIGRCILRGWPYGNSD